MRWLFLLVGAVACSGADEPAPTDTTPAPTGDTGPAGPGTMVLGFDLDPDLVPGMEEPAVGVFLGALYAEADASPFGPVEGATPILEFSTDPIDFGATGGLKEAVITLEDVPAQIVWMLGCLDTDANDCECKDPVTIPNENKVQVTSGEAAYTVTLSILDPC